MTSTLSDHFEVVNPGTNAVVGSHPIHTAEDIAERLTLAREVQPWWVDQGWAGRKQIMTNWVRWLAAHAEEIYELGHQETARPIPDVQMEFIAGLEEIRWAAANARRILKPRAVAPGHRPRQLRRPRVARAARRHRADHAVERPDLHDAQRHGVLARRRQRRDRQAE
jgi:acyl-CoA reductase-like NAD-dependent aldehyde dehydrogenase